MYNEIAPNGSFARVNYYVKKIASGYLVEYYVDGNDYQRAFETWKETLDFLKNNPPRVLERVDSKEYLDIEEIA